jgi:hypothetical protein
MKVRDVMVSPVITVRPSSSVKEVARTPASSESGHKAETGPEPEILRRLPRRIAMRSSGVAIASW